jgi:circadian clock protein KaiB
MKRKVRTQVEFFEEALKGSKDKKYILRLYVTGTTPRSTEAIVNIKKVCEEYLKGSYELEVIDIYQQPVLAKGEQIIATPTLVKRLPQPLRRFIGSMYDVDRILMGLDLKPKDRIEPEPVTKTRQPERKDRK